MALRSRAEAVSAEMQGALSALLGPSGPGADASLLAAHLGAAYDRLAFAAHGDRRFMQPSAMVAREEFALPVDAAALLRTAATLLGRRLDDVPSAPPEPDAHARAAAAPRAEAATREHARRSQLGAAGRLDVVYLGF
jgi:hypothetical protein